MTLTDLSISTAERRHGLDVGRSAEDPWRDLPAGLRGLVRDCDSHLILPPDVTYEILGRELGEPMRVKRQRQYDALDGLTPFHHDRSSVWACKGTMAHGAHDPIQRLEVLDEMGVRQQLVFGSGMASIFWSAPELAYAAAARFNEFVSAWCSADPDRLRPAGIVPCQDPERAVETARHAIALGLKAVQLAFYPDLQPAPADSRWEPLWALLGQSGVPTLLHWDMRWSLIESAGESAKLHVRSGRSLGEVGGAVSADDLKALLPKETRTNTDVDFAIMTVHRTPEHFLSSLALDGVFERHPQFRLGIFECTSFWVGPWLQRLDALQASIRGTHADQRHLSDVVRRAVKITPLYGEPFAQQMRLGSLQDMFVFATDYPHPEGGLQPLQEVAGQLTGEPELVANVLVKNAASLFPEV